jgi:hypothetical protein
MSIPHVDDKTLSVEMVMTPLPLDTAMPLDKVIDLARNMKDKGRGSVVVTEYVTDSAGNKTGTWEKDIGFFCGFNMHETERLPGTEKVEGEAEAIIKADKLDGRVATCSSPNQICHY